MSYLELKELKQNVNCVASPIILAADDELKELKQNVNTLNLPLLLFPTFPELKELKQNVNSAFKGLKYTPYTN